MDKSLEETNPLVTVVAVTYNSSAYVREAIESILASAYENIELVIGDDASTDNTWSIVNEYSDSRIIKYKNERNIGEYPNRNKAIDISKGKYLIFIDGDDMLYAHGLDFMVKMFEAFPSCGMALMWWNQNNIFFPVTITPQQFYIGEYFGRSVLGSSFANVFFKTRILKEEGGLPTTFRNGDDFIRYKIAAKYPSLIINDGMTWWRETPGQASQRIQNEHSHIEQLYSMKFSFLNSANCPLSEADKVLAYRNLCVKIGIICRSWIIRGKLAQALALMRKFSIPLSFLLNTNSNFQNKDPFEGYTSANAFRLALTKNPFAKNISK